MANGYVHDNSAKDGIALAHSVYGDPVTATMRPDSHGDNIGPATWSTAPYVPPARRHRDNPERKLCSFEGCKGYPSKAGGGDYCIGHAKSLGLVRLCRQPDCKGMPSQGDDYCYHHKPKVNDDATADAG